jgi:hypothetical protein
LSQHLQIGQPGDNHHRITPNTISIPEGCTPGQPADVITDWLAGIFILNGREQIIVCDPYSLVPFSEHLLHFSTFMYRTPASYFSPPCASAKIPIMDDVII